MNLSEVARRLNLDEVSRRLNSSKGRVLAWIRAKELRAINASINANSQRPRWVVTEEDLADFERRRASMPAPAPATPKSRKKAAASAPNYFS